MSAAEGLLVGKRILVTGATGGIGTEICRKLHRDGARLAIHYGSSDEQAQALVAQGGDRGSVALQADLTSEGGPDGLWDAATDALGGIDVLVNNAGLWIYSRLEPEEEWLAGWDANMDLNLRQAAWLTRRAVLDFRKQGGGAIISMASRSSLRGDDGEHLAYGVAKAGLQNLMKGVARAFAHEGVLAYSIAPAMVATRMIAGHMPPERLAALPMREVVPPEDVAETVAFLASGRARHMTGATLDIMGADYVR
ncbi:SDR family NAD(P)-dependent oxidoreductase [Leucobacter sp. wl10]|uniref:SDR family NAD(P)-dependent oxidoreductase n=1 Tax=Leucobacter sp. wl10 TaxID=2304677 RepID=UPI000E5C324F|nr:SDR family oxidoreductase [Leucobacter sp. wl10]RGE22022.1 SDR family oxidoreductase [Leucobacter sp. wl10]